MFYITAVLSCELFHNLLRMLIWPSLRTALRQACEEIHIDRLFYLALGTAQNVKRFKTNERGM